MKWHNSQQTWSDRADRAVHNSRKKARYWEDPETAREKMRTWRAENSEAQKEIERRTRERNAANIRGRNAAYREKNHTDLVEKSRVLYFQTRILTPWKNVLRSAMRRALEKGIPFSLSAEWAEKTWTGRCALTDIAFATTPFPSFYSPSIDRIIPALGYIPDNCRFILFSINAFKNTESDEAMYLVAEALLRKRVTSKLAAQ